MVQIKIYKEIPENKSLILLTTPECNYEQYGFSEKETVYVRSAVEAKEARIAVNKGGYWVYIQVLDDENATDKGKEKLRQSAAKIHQWITQQKISEVTIVSGLTDKESVYAFAEGLALANYQFLKYVSKKEDKEYSLKSLSVQGESVGQEDVDRLNYVLAAVYKARDLVNEPANFLNSVRLAGEIQEMGKEAGFQVEVFNKKAIEDMKMGGILAVNKGSVEEPSFSVLEWKPADAKNEHPVVLVGKGIVYDSGGYSLKPTTNSMDYMKSDMAGSAAVAAAIYAVAKAGLPVYVIGLIPSTDNRISAEAYSPGDIITMYDGTTVEVLNTDAEGRLILADALSYAKKYRPELVIDLATLTGAAQRAVGEQAMAGMGNAPREVMEKLKDCGEAVCERIAEFPFWDDYAESLKSDIADLKNMGGEYAGAITAGKFLEHFTDYPYIHLDIAGPSFLKANDGYRTKGGTGTGVRLLFEFLKNY